MATAKKPGVRFAAVITLTLIAAAALSACGGGGGSTPTETPATAGPAVPITPAAPTSCTAPAVLVSFTGEQSKCSPSPGTGWRFSTSLQTWVAVASGPQVDRWIQLTADEMKEVGSVDWKRSLFQKTLPFSEAGVRNGQAVVRAHFVTPDGKYCLKTIFEATGLSADPNNKNAQDGACLGGVVTWAQGDSRGTVFMATDSILRLFTTSGDVVRI